jgi:hypothetical protein
LSGCRPESSQFVEPPNAVRATEEQPWMQMSGVTTEVTREGQTVERISAEWARFDEKDRILHMRKTELRFYDRGAIKDVVASGKGTLWLNERPGEGIGRNDLLLEQDVVYQTSAGWLLRSPKMRFDYANSVLRTDAGFVKEMRVGDNTIEGTGTGFEVKLSSGGGALESFAAFGDPLVFRNVQPAVVTP